MVKKGNYYQWPTNEDASTEPFEVILKYLSPPKLQAEISSKRLKYFVVTIADTKSGQTADTVPPEKLPPQKPAVSDEPATAERGLTADNLPPEKVQPQHPDEVEAADSQSEVNR